MSETIQLLYVEDDSATRDAIRKTILSLNYANFQVKAVGNFEDARVLLENAGVEEFDLILSDYELNPGTGVRVFEIATELGLKSDFAIYTARNSIDLPTGEAYESLRQNLWSPSKLFEHLRRWVERRRRCSVSVDGKCLWSELPSNLSLRATPYYYVSMPYDDYYDLRRARLTGLFKETRLTPELTKEAAYDDALDHMIHAIRRSTFVVADLEHCRPTVMTEIGIAIALQKRLLILYPKDLQLPFSVARATAMPYESPIWEPDGVDTAVHGWLKRLRLIPSDRNRPTVEG